MNVGLFKPTDQAKDSQYCADINLRQNGTCSIGPLVCEVACMHAEFMPDVSTLQLAQKGGKRWMHMGTHTQCTLDRASLSVTQLALQ